MLIRSSFDLIPAIWNVH